MVSKKINLTSFLIQQAERRTLSDMLIRAGIRHLLRKRLKLLTRSPRRSPEEQLQIFKQQLSKHAVTEETQAANEQHYELPPDFFKEVLGPNLKYSSALWWVDTKKLGEAEANMLDVSIERAGIADGMDILELGCGWGSLTFWMAKHFPNAKITAVTNSKLQADHIQHECASRAIENIRVVKTDVGTFEPNEQFDRIVSVEMLEHVRNYGTLFDRIYNWMRPGAKFFVHVFTHTDYPYLFETEDDTDWMAKYFFTGGTMPSHDLLPSFRGKLNLERDWEVNGTHYAKTLESWLQNIDDKESRVRAILSQCYPANEVEIWIQRWRMFMMASAELFAFNKGRSWGVSHYVFSKPGL